MMLITARFGGLDALTLLFADYRVLYAQTRDLVGRIELTDKYCARVLFLSLSCRG
jgi:hypothetical protein